jgi:YHS domain-containing protein
MEFLAQLVRLLFWLVALTWIARKIFSWLFPAPPRPSEPPQPLEPKPLHRDPCCGTYVSAEISYPLDQSGETIHFCSAECRQRYLASEQRSAGA